VGAGKIGSIFSRRKEADPDRKEMAAAATATKAKRTVPKAVAEDPGLTVWSTVLPTDSLHASTTWYAAAEPVERAEALRLGAHVFTTLKAMKAGEEVAAAEARAAAEIARIRDASAAALAALQAEMDAAAAAAAIAATRAAAAAAAEKERMTRATTTQVLEAQAELAAIKERYDALQERRRVLEEGRDADIRVAEERTRTLLQTTLDEKERAIVRSERTLAGLQAAYERQTEELRVLADLVRKKPAAGSKAKGSEYETAFREKLVAAFGTGDRFRITDSAHSGIGHAGDYLMNWGDHTLLWEVKNYDRPVPSAEVEKFRRDMKENAQVRVGAMISRFTPITGRVATGDREIEIYEGKLLIYLSNFEGMAEDTLPSLMLLFKTWWSLDRGAAAADVGSEEEERKAAAIRQIERLHADAAKARTDWRLHKSRMDDAMRWMAERVDETESRLKAALNILQGGAGAMMGGGAAIPEGFFRDVSGDERALTDVAAILRCAKPQVGAVIELNALADAVGKDRGYARETAKQHIRAVLLDSVLETPKGRPHRVLGFTLIAT
jgi:hypothetical protein